MPDLKIINVDLIGHPDHKFAQEHIKQTKTLLDKLTAHYIETSKQNKIVGKNYVHHENQYLVIKSVKHSNKLMGEEIRDRGLYFQGITTESRLSRLNDRYRDAQNKSINLLQMRQKNLEKCKLCVEIQNDLIQTITGENKQQFESLADIINQQIDGYNDLDFQRLSKFERTFDNKAQNPDIKFPEFKVKESEVKKSMNRVIAFFVKLFTAITQYFTQTKEYQKLLESAKNDLDEALRNQHDLNHVDDLLSIIVRHLDDCVLHEATFDKLVNNCLSRIQMISMESDYEDVMQEINHYVDLEWEDEDHDLVWDGYHPDEDYYEKLLDETFEDQEIFKPLHQTKFFKETFRQMNQLQRSISEELLFINQIKERDPWVRIDTIGESPTGEVEESVRRALLSRDFDI